jgi:hypothetical protein
MIDPVVSEVGPLGRTALPLLRAPEWREESLSFRAPGWRGAGRPTPVVRGGGHGVQAGAYGRPGSAACHSVRVSIRPATAQASRAHDDGRTSQR